MPEDPPREIVEQCAIALAFAAPVGVALSLMLGRRLTHAHHRAARRGDREREADDRRAARRAPAGQRRRATRSIGCRPRSTTCSTRIESGVAAQQQFAADASHELRTPLAVISTNLEVARRKPRDAAHWEHVADDTLAEVHRMNVLVDKLLAAVARRRRRAAPRARRSARARRAPRSSAPRTLAASAGSRSSSPPAARSSAEVDPDAIGDRDRQPDAQRDRSLADAARRSRSASSAGPRIAVDDRGPGVPAELRARIFEPFARGAQRTDRAAGTGLRPRAGDLQAHRRRPRRHDRVDDRSGGGARFVGQLPPPETTEPDLAPYASRGRSTGSRQTLNLGSDTGPHPSWRRRAGDRSDAIRRRRVRAQLHLAGQASKLAPVAGSVGISISGVDGVDRQQERDQVVDLARLLERRR